MAVSPSQIDPSAFSLSDHSTEGADDAVRSLCTGSTARQSRQVVVVVQGWAAGRVAQLSP